ncbi:MAG: hypothetical protein C5B52_17910 [Bacteroidetes bacterium]|nr:MAG: hypothetical protein C5B52_17910 [Bacteroidota bacterium]
MNSADDITLIVLPFEGHTLQKDVDIFCRSFSNDLITELSKFKQFLVLNYPKSKGGNKSNESMDISQMDVDYYIQGSLRFQKNSLLVNVQLFNNRLQHLVWGNRFEGALSELSEIQDSLLTEVVGVLQKQINLDLLSKIKKRTKVEFRAYEYWLHGMEELKKGNVEYDLKAREHFAKAIEIQPDYSLAYSGMSQTYFNEWSCQLWDRWEVSQSAAFEWAQKAMELDDQNYVAAQVLGKIFLFEGSYESAEYFLRKSLLLNSNDAETVIQIAAYFMYLDLGVEAIELYERAIKLDPVNAQVYKPFGSLIYFELGQFEKAASLIVLSQGTKWADAEAFHAAIYHYLQEPEKSKRHWNLFIETYGKLIAKGQSFTDKDASDWLLKINPFRKKSYLEGFLNYVNNENIREKSFDEIAEDKNPKIKNSFAKDAVGWKISYNGNMMQIPESKGLFDIQKLISNPRQLFHCAELMGSVLDERGEKLFDAKAKKEYEKKILELQSDIQEAELHSNFVQSEKLQLEYDRLLDHLGQSLGNKGKARESNGSIEKARSAVTWRIRKAIARIESLHPTLGAHLSNSIKTGTFCSYSPESDISWELE